MKKKRLIIAGIVFALAFAADKLFPSMPWFINLITFGTVYIFVAYDVLWKAVRNIGRGEVFDENFLMTVASVGAFIAGEFAEAAAVMLFYQVGEYFQDYAVNKSRKQISELMNIRPDKAFVFEEGEMVEYEPEDVCVGAELVVKNGERIPLDGTLLSDNAVLDTAALTGEALPINLKKGDSCLSGAINLGGVIHIRTEKEYYDSTVGRILDMVECASGKKAAPEKFITKFARWYTPAVVGLAVLLAIVPSLITGEWSVWVMRVLTFLVVSCPCALVISVPLSFFGGIGGASGKGILIKGGGYLELLQKVNTFVFDKTGTLTKGKFEVAEVYPPQNRENVLKKAAIAEAGSNHPIAKCVVETAKNQLEFDLNTPQFEEIAGKGIIAELGQDRIVCGNKELMKSESIEITQCSGNGSVVYVAENGEFLGYILVADSLKPEAKSVISELKRQGAKTVMLTGDVEENAREVANAVGLDEYKAGLLPTDKVDALEELFAQKKEGDVIAFVGDGINDAPVLMRADVGISMGGVGSDSAIEASDMVLMYDDLNALVTARKVSEKTMRIVKQNIIFALVVKFGVLALSAFGFANMWLAVFADVGVAFLAILNAMRCMNIGKKGR